MGLVQSKKEGIVRKFQIKIDLQAQIKRQLLDLCSWSFPDIKTMYDSYCRKTDCPFVDFFIFHKMMPFTTEVSKVIFDAYAEGDKYINIFELTCILILISHNNYRKKLQFLFMIFDFGHLDQLKNRQLLLIFECYVNGFCRMTGQTRPKYDYLTKYTIERFIRVNTLEALEKVVSYRRLIEQVEGNNDTFDLFKRYDQQIYGFFTQESYLFKVNQYKKYSREDIEKLYRIIRKANSQNNYEEVEMVDKNRRFRLENRKIQCIKQLIDSKEDKFKNHQSSIKIRSNSLLRLGTLPMINRQRPSLSKMSPLMMKSSTFRQQKQSSKTKLKNKRVLLLNGKITSKEDIFQTIQYFKNLSSNKNQIKIKQFFKSFEKKVFFKKQISSLFKYFDKKKKGEIKFEDFLKVYYQNITKDQIQLVKEWFTEYKSIHQADDFDIQEFIRRRQKKAHIELPSQTIKRIKQIFDSIDRDKKGHLNIEDLKKAYNTGFSIKQLQDMIKQFGKNGKIYPQEFITMTLPEQWTIQGTNYVGS